jgi:hypothetical protein
MAGASVAMPSDLSGFNANPATLGFIKKGQVAVGYRSVLLDVWGGFVAAAIPLGAGGIISINAIDLSEGTLNEVVENPADHSPLSTNRVWSSNSFAGGLSWAKPVWETLALGVMLKGAYHKIGTPGASNLPGENYSADGIAADLGLQYRLLGGRFISGISARNLGFLESGYSTAADGYPMPFSIAAGISFIPRYTPALRLALDLEKTRDNFATFKPGIEISLIPQTLQLRFGFPFSTNDLGYFFDLLGGTPASGYQKSQWNILCSGIGFSTASYGTDLTLDAGIEFHTDVSPSVVLTCTYAY